MKSIFWLMICYQVLVYKTCYTTELKVEIELTDFTWKNMDQVQSFFRKVFPLEYQIYHFKEMMHGDLVKVAFHGKKIIGFLYSHSDIIKSNVFVIASIGCLPNYRRRGVGSYLFELALNYAEQKGCYDIIRLYVQTCNKVALKFYKKYGFKIIKEEPDYYSNTVDADAYQMEKIIIHPLKREPSSLNRTIDETQEIRNGNGSERSTEKGNDINLKLAMKLKEILHQKFDDKNS